MNARSMKTRFNRIRFDEASDQRTPTGGYRVEFYVEGVRGGDQFPLGRVVMSVEEDAFSITFRGNSEFHEYRVSAEDVLRAFERMGQVGESE